MGTILAVAAAVGAALAGSPGPLGTAPLVVVACGLALVPAGAAVGGRGHRLVARGLSVVGVAVSIAALVGTVALSPPLAVLLPTLSSGVGLIALSFGLHFVSGSAARSIALAGLTLVFLAIVANAVVAGATWRPVAAVALVVVAWDGADRAITLGWRVGADAGTAAVELLGVATTAAVAVTGIGVAVVAARLPVGVPSVPGLALLLAAAVVLVLALSSVPDPG